MKNFVCGGVLIVALVIASCEKGAYKDGVYTGASAEDDTGAWGEVEIRIEAGKIRGCEFVTRQKDGTIKGEDYGKVNGEIANQAYYDKAQLAVEAMKQYATDYLRTGSLKGLDAVSGATIAYNQFIEAVESALEQANSR
jgi:major membrane immunogen (membrane-anchored lipoprotein)